MKARLQRYLPAPTVSVALTLSVMLALLLPLQKSTGPLEPDQIHPARYAELATSTTPYPFTSSTFPPRKVPILVYHIVRPSYPDDSAEVRMFAQTPEVFDAQMGHLREAGYHVIPLAELVRALRLNTPLPSKPVVITFDDGWRNQFVYGFPIVAKYHYPATFYVFTDVLGRHGFMTWDNLHVLMDSGMTIGSHTRTHPFLSQIHDREKLDQEIRGSKHILEQKLHVPIYDFAYPYGQFTDAIAQETKTAGYRSARGDLDSGDQSLQKLYALSAFNAPISIARFTQLFP